MNNLLNDFNLIYQKYDYIDQRLVEIYLDTLKEFSLHTILRAADYCLKNINIFPKPNIIYSECKSFIKQGIADANYLFEKEFILNRNH